MDARGKFGEHEKCVRVARGAERRFITQGNLQGGRVEDHRMMFTKHLYLMQSYIQAVLYIYITIYIYIYIYITDYMMSLTLQYQNAYSPNRSLYISLCACKENLFNNQEVLQLIIIYLNV